MSLGHAINVHEATVDHRTDHGTVRALAPTSVTIDGGEGVAIMGASGCGKSTLLGLLAGLATPTRGTVTVGHDDVSSLPERGRVRFRRREVGMVYQADNLLPHLTVEENVGLQLAICHQDSRGAAHEPDVLLDRLGLGELAGRLPDQLSGGQRQRVAVARAIVHGPAVILADEPTGALDGGNAMVVIELLTEMHRRSGATLVIVTHDPAIAAHLGRTIELESPC